MGRVVQVSNLSNHFGSNRSSRKGGTMLVCPSKSSRQGLLSERDSLSTLFQNSGSDQSESKILLLVARRNVEMIARIEEVSFTIY